MKIRKIGFSMIACIVLVAICLIFSHYDDAQAAPEGGLRVQYSGVTPTISNVDTLLADTQYSVTIPAGTKHLKIRNVGGGTRISFTAGLVANAANDCWTIVSGGSLELPDIYFANSSTLYIATDTAGSKIEVISTQ